MRNYVRSSLELHLFFARIMKEHSLFLQAGFMPISKEYICKAEKCRMEFEKLLSDVVELSDCRVCQNFLDSGEMVTQYTCDAEKQTSNFTGFDIDTNITLKELELRADGEFYIDRNTLNKISFINNRALQLVDGLIELKEKILCEVLKCKLFTANYPLLLEHILREAKLYRQYITMIQNGRNINCQDKRNIEMFWNQIMMEHALFIRGLLDPTEEELICTADKFAQEYRNLLEDARCKLDETIDETVKYRDFKMAGANGIINCKIRSIILPLLADHVLREANHYLRLLKEG